MLNFICYSWWSHRPLSRHTTTYDGWLLADRGPSGDVAVIKVNFTMSWQFLFTFKNLLQFSLMCDILRWSCNIVRHRATSSYILLCLDLIYTNINAKGHATMILSNIRMCMQFAKNVQFISCCNLTYAYVMRLSWVSPCEWWLSCSHTYTDLGGGSAAQEYGRWSAILRQLP